MFREEVGGVPLAVREQGQGPAVLLVHGTAPPLWGTLPGLLARTHRVIEYDRRSFGASPGQRPKDLGRHAEDAAALLTRLDAGPALVVGWSMGGMVALELACRQPQLAAGLVLLEPPFRAKRQPRPAMLSAVGGAVLLGRLGRPEAGAERFLRWALRRRDGSSAFADAGPQWREAVRRDSAAIVAELDAHLPVDDRAIAALRMPIRILVGSLTDRVFAVAAHRLRTLVRGGELSEVAGSGHALPFDASLGTAAAVGRLVPA
jgi:pimeloyl-ACP methyl ester carboxylesterase